MKWGLHFDIATAIVRIEELENELLDPSIWNDLERSQKVMQETKILKNKVENYNKLSGEYEDIITLIEMGLEESDTTIYSEANKLAKDFIKTFEALKIATLLRGEYDKNNAILTLHSGAGGTESCDWVSMLLRMYTKFAEKSGYTVEILDILSGEEAGIKSVTIQINGENAFGYLKSEKGVHRLVRISPFDSSGRRHTSFASCDIMPELDENADFEIKEDEIRVDTFRSGGAGGQHVNTTDSAIRITHIPTNTVVQCQNERSQHKNKDRAMKVLKARLFELRETEKLEKLVGIRGEVKEIGWGSQIRSYVFHPYNMVKDHRTSEEVGNVYGVMDGNINTFINAYLNWLVTS